MTAARVRGRAVLEGVRFPVESEDVQDGEEGHFHDEQHGGDADVDVWVAELVVGLEGSVGGGGEADHHGLPEGEEDDEFDADYFERGLVGAQVLFELDVELHEAEHGDGDAGAFEADDPDVREGRAE